MDVKQNMFFMLFGCWQRTVMTSRPSTSVRQSSCLCFFTGINKQIAVDAAYFPVVSSDDPRAVGLPQDPHGNTMLSCLSSGFLCPLSDHSEATLPEPGSHHAKTVTTQFGLDIRSNKASYLGSV